MRKKNSPDDLHPISEDEQAIIRLWKKVHVDIQRAAFLWSKASGPRNSGL